MFAVMVTVNVTQHLNPNPWQIIRYDCISQGKSCSKKRGLIIYIDNKFDSELVINLNTYTYWEGIA